MKKTIIMCSMILSSTMINAENYLIKLNDDFDDKSILVKSLEDSEKVIAKEGEIIRFNFSLQSDKSNLAYNLLDDTTLSMDNEATLWHSETDGGAGVIKSKANISNPYGANKNYEITVRISKDSVINATTTGGLPRLISMDGTINSTLGWYRDGCSSDAFVVRYYNASSTLLRPVGNISSFCSSWISGSENTVIYKKEEETLTITVNGTKIGEYTNLHPTLNNLSENAKFLTNIGAYSSETIYIKELSVIVSN
jgi:hypothetical protein